MKVDAEFGQRIVDTVKTASDLLDAANTRLDEVERELAQVKAAKDQTQSKIASFDQDEEQARQLHLQVVDKLASTVLDNEAVIYPDNVEAFRNMELSKTAMAKFFLETLEVLSPYLASQDKTASAASLGEPSNAVSPYQDDHRPQSGFASLARYTGRNIF